MGPLQPRSPVPIAGGFRDAQAQRLNGLAEYEPSGVRGILHRDGSVLSVVVEGSRHNQRRIRQCRQSEITRQFARTVTAQKPFNSPFSGCNRIPGMSISATVRAASSLAKISRNLTMCSAITPRGSSSQSGRTAPVSSPSSHLKAVSERVLLFAVSAGLLRLCETLPRLLSHLCGDWLVSVTQFGAP